MPSGQYSRNRLLSSPPRHDRVERRTEIPRVYAWSHAPLVVKPNRHPMLLMVLHWGSMLALIIAVAVMFVRDAIEDDSYRLVLLQIHRQLGLLLLVAVVWRVVARLRRGLADHAPDMAFLLRWSAKAMHVFLYGVLLALPLVGWALTSAHGVWLSFLGVVRLPMLVTADSEFADTLSDYHIWLAWCLLALVAAHAAAALWHHFGRRDTVLTAMLPGKPRAKVFVDRRRPQRSGPLDSPQSGALNTVGSVISRGE